MLYLPLFAYPEIQVQRRLVVYCIVSIKTSTLQTEKLAMAFIVCNGLHTRQKRKEIMS